MRSPEKEITETLRRAVEWLLGTRSASTPLWEDFSSTAGASSEWVTGFVLWGLGDRGAPAVSAGQRALARCQRKDGSWGFCERVPGDADSTAWAVLGLADSLSRSQRKRALGYLRAQQDARGGFRTYPPDIYEELAPWAPRDESYAGWFAPHTCVTAAVMQSLLALGEAPDSPPLLAAGRYLLAMRDRRGLFPSYWWSGVTYSCYHALSALRGCNLLRERHEAEAANQLVRRQLARGGWAWDGSADGRPGAFETAFALLALQALERSGVGGPEIHESASAGIAWLVRNQTSAGRWPAKPILRVPLPSDPHEWLGTCQDRPRRDGLGSDVAGAFTAAAAARCLTDHLELIRAGDPPGTTSARRILRRRRPPAPRIVPAALRLVVVNEATAAFAQTMIERGLDMPATTRRGVLRLDRLLGTAIARQLPRRSDRLHERAQNASVSARRGATLPSPWPAVAVASLSFGAAMARVLADAQGIRCAPEAAELAANLVLGTGVVDHICDESPAMRGELFSLLSEDALLRLIAGANPRRVTESLAHATEHGDVRYALRLVGAYFDRLNRWVDDARARERIARLLVSAYTAERASVTPGPALRNGETVRSNAAPRVLPLMIVSTVNCALGGHFTAAAGCDCDRFATILGTAISSLDDLADLCVDARTGAVNSLLEPHGTEGTGNAAIGAHPADRLTAVLNSGACWDAAATIADSLEELCQELPAAGTDGVPPRDRLLAHLWGWGDLPTAPYLEGLLTRSPDGRQAHR